MPSAPRRLVRYQRDRPGSKSQGLRQNCQTVPREEGSPPRLLLIARHPGLCCPDRPAKPHPNRLVRADSLRTNGSARRTLQITAKFSVSASEGRGWRSTPNAAGALPHRQSRTRGRDGTLLSSISDSPSATRRTPWNIALKPTPWVRCRFRPTATTAPRPPAP
jgi:hypothetical protein